MGLVYSSVGQLDGLGEDRGESKARRAGRVRVATCFCDSASSLFIITLCDGAGEHCL